MPSGWYRSWRLVTTLISGPALLIPTIYFAAASEAFAQTPADRALNIMLIAIGCALGWIVGILVSPAANEKEKFKWFTKAAIGLFASGYAAGRADKLLDRLLDPSVSLSPLSAFRCTVFAVALMASATMVFVFRSYALEHPETEHAPD
jgi:hypothetical protein